MLLLTLVPNMYYCRVLTRLVLEGCVGITDMTMEVIRLTNNRLTHLNIKECHKITDRGIRLVVTGCRSLRDFIAADLVGLTDNGIQAISEALKLYRSIRVLDLSGSKHFSNESLLLLLQDGGGILQRVYLNGCTQVNELGLMGLRRTGKTSMDMIRLDLSNTVISSPALCWISEGCKRLAHLNLSGCKQITDSALLYVAAQGVMPLRSLSLAGCSELTDYGMVALLESSACCGLRSLDVSSCIFLGDDSLHALAKSCPRLKHLILAGVTKYTDLSLNLLGQMCKGLLTIDLSMELHGLDTSRRSRVPRYTSNGVMRLSSHCKTLRSIKLSGASKMLDYSLTAIRSCTGASCFPFKHIVCVFQQQSHNRPCACCNRFEAAVDRRMLPDHR